MHKLSRKAALVQGALLIHLQPLMAADSKPDLAPFLVGVTAKNFKASRAAILAGVRRATAGKLAADAVLDLDAVGRMIETLEGVNPAEEDDVSPFVPAARTSEPDPVAADEDPLAKIKEFLKGKISDEDLAQLDGLYGAPIAEDEETPEEKAAREAKIRSDARSNLESMQNARGGADVTERAERAKGAEAIAQDQRRRTAESNFAERYPEAARIGQDPYGKQPAREPVRAMDRKAAPTQAKARAFHDRYPDAAKVQKL